MNGWRYWISDYPRGHERVEIAREAPGFRFTAEGLRPAETVTIADLPPEFNVAGLWWRPVIGREPPSFGRHGVGAALDRLSIPGPPHR